LGSDTGIFAGSGTLNLGLTANNKPSIQFRFRTNVTMKARMSTMSCFRAMFCQYRNPRP
jgi:hypothetical protein